MKKLRLLLMTLCVTVLMGSMAVTAYAGGGEEWDGLAPVEPLPTESAPAAPVVPQPVPQTPQPAQQPQPQAAPPKPEKFRVKATPHRAPAKPVRRLRSVNRPVSQLLQDQIDRMGDNQ